MSVRKRILYVFLAVLFAVTTLKILFTGYDIDEQYAVSLAGRLLKGDLLLADMWEPHQTSAWLCTLLLLPYVALFHTTTGIFLYLRFCGLLIHAAVGAFLYKTLTHFIERERALLIGCIYFFTLPKLMFLPEFSNIQVWCLLAAILCLLRYYGYSASRPGSRRLYCLVLAGCFLTLEVLSYPSTIFAFAACLCGMICYRRSPRSLLRELLCLSVPCLTGALAFLAMLLSYIPLGEMGHLISMVLSDGSHSAPWPERLLAHGQSLLQILLFFLVYALAAALLQMIYCLKSKTAFSLLLWSELLIACSLAGQVIIWLFGDKYPNYPLVEYLFLPLLALGGALLKKLPRSPVLVFFVLVPLAAFVGIILSSNHPLLVSLPFLVPCVAGILSLPQLQEAAAAERRTGRLQAVLVLWVFVLLFGRCYMQRTTGGRHETLLDDMSLLRRGPGLGLIADTRAAVRYRDNLELVTKILPKGAKVFYMGSYTDVYLMQDLEYSTPSTICSPTFDDKINIYFQTHPDRQPDYILCDRELPSAQPWVADYLEVHCFDQPVAVNDYMAIYRVRRWDSGIDPEAQRPTA